MTTNNADINVLARMRETADGANRSDTTEAIAAAIKLNQARMALMLAQQPR